jgi:hypothetical protein
MIEKLPEHYEVSNLVIPSDISKKINEMIDKINELESRQGLFGTLLPIGMPFCTCYELVGDGSKQCPKCGRLI